MLRLQDVICPESLNSVVTQNYFLYNPTSITTPILWMGKQRPKELTYIYNASLFSSDRDI